VQFLVDRDVMVPMHNGVRLATDVWRRADVPPLPAILVRLATGKDRLDFWGAGLMPAYPDLLEAGYALVWQDQRGTGRSEGAWRVMGDDRRDGEDTVEWIASQPWCDGRVAGAGPSHMGMAQWAIASTGSPHFTAMAPAIAPRDYYWDIYYNEGGALSLRATMTAALTWSLAGARRALAQGELGREEYDRIVAGVRAARSQPDRLPLTDHPGLALAAPWWREVLAHPVRDDHWAAACPAPDPAAVTVPALNIGGWYDHCLRGTLDGYVTMRREGGSAAAREGQRLIVGPWTHTSQEGVFPQRHFGPRAGAAAADIPGEYLRFYQRWLKGDSTVDPGPPVRIFVMGADVWREEQDWPLPDTAWTDYFLSSSGAANTAAGDGVLSTETPTGTEFDLAVSDPRRPVPSRGGADSGSPMLGEVGPTDQREVEARGDVLCYTTPPLAEPVEVTGPVELVVYLSSSAVDTDVMGKLVDVYPDGRGIQLTEGMLRARYRCSRVHPEALVPGEVVELRLSLRATSNVFLPGHRIRLEVAGSNYPRYARNPNTGGDVASVGRSDVVAAVNRVHHGPGWPSRLILPVIRR
jgi:putative CocE/NonD family hydrolase